MFQSTLFVGLGSWGSVGGPKRVNNAPGPQSGQNLKVLPNGPPIREQWGRVCIQVRTVFPNLPGVGPILLSKAIGTTRGEVFRNPFGWVQSLVVSGRWESASAGKTSEGTRGL